jgi:hypothetical protein
MTAPELRTFADGGRNATPPSTTGPAAPGVNVTVKDARSKSLNKQPQHPATGRFVKRNGGRPR